MICSLKFKQEVILKMLLWVLCFWFWSYAQIQVEDDVCSVASPTCQTFQIQAKISPVRPILQTIFPLLMTMLQAILTCQFCVCSEYMPPYGGILQISWAESNLRCFFPSVNTVKHRRWNFVCKCFTAWRLQQLEGFNNKMFDMIGF